MENKMYSQFHNINLCNLPSIVTAYDLWEIDRATKQDEDVEEDFDDFHPDDEDMEENPF